MIIIMIMRSKTISKSLHNFFINNYFILQNQDFYN